MKSLKAWWDHRERPLEPELALKTEASDDLRKMTRKHYHILSYFLLLASCLLWKWQHRKKGKDRLIYSSFSLHFFLSPHKVKGRECWQNVSGGEIKRGEFILCTGSTVLVRTKYARMHMCASFQNQIVTLSDSTYELATHVCTESWYCTIQRWMENLCC